MSARRRPAQPTNAARRRRKQDVHNSYQAPMLPPRAEYGADVRRAIARERVRWPLDLLRDDVLRTIATLAPQVLKQLAAIDLADEPLLRGWAKRWNIDAPWVLIVARNTIKLWRAWPAVRGQQWDVNHEEQGERLPIRGRLQKRPPEMLVRQDHLAFFVRRRVLGERCEDITDPPDTARKAVRTLALRLGLQRAKNK